MRFGIVQQFWNAVGDGDRMLVTVQFTELSIRFHRADNPKIKEKTDDAVVWS